METRSCSSALFVQFAQQTVTGFASVTPPLAVALPAGAHEPPEGVTVAFTKNGGETAGYDAHEPGFAASKDAPAQVELLETLPTTEHDTPLGEPQLQPSTQVRVSVPEP
jgi:hypothetical protein